MKLELYYRTIVTDKNGRTVKRSRWRKSRSFVLAFLQHIEWLSSHAYASSTFPTIVIKDVANAGQTMFTATGITTRFLCMFAPDDIDTYGIVIGTGTTAPTNSDYKLETQIAHGVTATKMDYGAHSKTAAGVVGANVDYVVSRTFYNGSGSTITVTEIGIYLSSIDSASAQRYFCVVRDVITATAVLNTQTLTVQYTLRTTV